jgi:hypothetical protein
MIKSIRWTAKLLLLIAITPFGVFLSCSPAYQGPREWIEFCGMELFQLPDGWARGKDIVCYLQLIK